MPSGHLLRVDKLHLTVLNWQTSSTANRLMHCDVPMVQILEHCKYISIPAAPKQLHYRTHSNRCVSGTKPVWLKNVKIWTASRNGTEFTIVIPTVLD